MDTMWFDLSVAAIMALVVLLMVLQLAGMLGWVERKGSALIQDRIGANRAAIFGFTGFGLVNTLMADPLKFLTKEDIIPGGVDRLLHTLAPCIHLFPALVAFAVIPFGAVLIIGVEFWERFSFYGMLSILVLFLTASPSHGGFGWPSAEALALLGAYSGAMYAFPAFGGYFADRVLGRRRAVTLGATLQPLLGLRADVPDENIWHCRFP
jgi:NADH-quinone oxidoreductase subunit H